MAFKTIAEFASQWINGFVPQDTNYQDVWDSHEKSIRETTLTQGNTSMIVRYQADIAPTLTSDGQGSYVLTLSARTAFVGFDYRSTGQGTLTPGNSLILKVITASGQLRRSALIEVYGNVDNNEYGPLEQVRKKLSDGGAQESIHEITNMSNVGNWKLIGVLN